jgi:hypothetical protein
MQSRACAALRPPTRWKIGCLRGLPPTVLHAPGYFERSCAFVSASSACSLSAMPAKSARPATNPPIMSVRQSVRQPRTVLRRSPSCAAPPPRPRHRCQPGRPRRRRHGFRRPGPHPRCRLAITPTETCTDGEMPARHSTAQHCSVFLVRKDIFHNVACTADRQTDRQTVSDNDVVLPPRQLLHLLSFSLHSFLSNFVHSWPRCPSLSLLSSRFY